MEGTAKLEHNVLFIVGQKPKVLQLKPCSVVQSLRKGRGGWEEHPWTPGSRVVLLQTSSKGHTRSL